MDSWRRPHLGKALEEDGIHKQVQVDEVLQEQRV